MVKIVQQVVKECRFYRDRVHSNFCIFMRQSGIEHSGSKYYFRRVFLMKKKLLSVLLVLAMMASMLAGCGGNTDAGNDGAGSEANGEQQVLKFYHAYYHEESEWPVAAVMRDIYQDFADAHADGPVKFEIVTVEDVLGVATNEIAGGNFPDMVDFAGTAVPMAAVAQGLVLDLKPYIDSEGIQSKVGINYTMNDVDGKIYTVHDQLTTLGLWYNADLYAAAGATTPDQWTSYEDMATAMEALRASGVYAYNAGQGSMRLFNSYMQILNADYASSPLTEEIINSEEFATAFKTIAAMDQANGSAHSTNNAGDFGSDFNAGLCATWMNGVWAAGSFGEVEYNIQPGIYPGSGAIAATGGGLTISNSLTEEQKALALEFLKYMTSDEVQTRIFLEVNANPCNQDIDLKELAAGSDSATVKLLADACAAANSAEHIANLTDSVWGADVQTAIINKLIECSVEGTDINAKLQELQSELIALIG